MNLKRNVYLVLACIAVLFAGCSKKWDEHNEVTNPILNQKLLDKINADPELSKFSEYLVSTGYDSVLASSKTFTVWAPTNAALQAVDPTLIDTKEKLKLFVGNHLSTQTYLTIATEPSFIRVKTLNGKNVTFSATAVDGSPLASKDFYVGNGVLHTISTAIIPKVSAWEYLMSTNTIQKEELVKLNFTFFDPTKAEEIGVDANGNTLYKPGTGFFTRNSYLSRADISNEDSLYTYIVLTDAAFQTERTKLTRYHKLGTDPLTAYDSTAVLTNQTVIKDLAFKGILDKENFPASAYSVGDSVRFHLDKSAVVETRQVSNGVVYVMSSINYDMIGAGGTYDPYTKIKPVLIQGENINNNTDFLSVKTNSRPVRRAPDGKLYTQLQVENHATASYWARYKPNKINSTKYKVVWRVVRETNLVPARVGTAPNTTPGLDLVYFPMRIAFKSPALVTGFPYIPKPGVVPVLNPNGTQATDAAGNLRFAPDYAERTVYNEYEVDKYYASGLKANLDTRLPIYLVGNTTTGNGTNTLLLDYIMLIPIQ
jgi:uncharacterized surface protein with fasciclin (FAS1) repeats